MVAGLLSLLVVCLALSAGPRTAGAQESGGDEARVPSGLPESLGDQLLDDEPPEEEPSGDEPPEEDPIDPASDTPDTTSDDDPSDDGIDPGEVPDFGDPSGEDSSGDDSSGGDSGEDTEENGEGGQSELECSTEPGSSYSAQLLAPQGEDQPDRSYMICGTNHYYLTYVDFADNWWNPSSYNPGRGLRYAPYHALNGVASLVSTWNASLVSFGVDLLRFALEFDLVAALEEPVERVVSALGDGFFRVWLPAMYALAILYGAWLSIMRDRVAEGFTALAKAAVIGAFGLWIISGGITTISSGINDATNGITDPAFGAVTQIQPDAQSSEALGCSGDGQDCVSANIWEQFVLEPWSRLQISDSDADIARENREEILQISNPEDRAEALEDLGNQHEDDVKPTVDFIYSGTHVSLALANLVMSGFFVALLGIVSLLMFVSKMIVFFLLITSPVWLLAAVYPNSTIAARVGFWFFGEVCQIFGYKLLIGLVILMVGLIFAAGLGPGAVFALCIVVCFAAVRFHRQFRAFLQPTALARTLEARYLRGRQVRRDVNAARGGAFGSADGGGSPVGGRSELSGASGGIGGTGGASPSPRMSLAEASAQARSAGYLPQEVAGAGGAYAAGAGSQAVSTARSVPGRLWEDSQARNEEASRLWELAHKRAEDPESLSESERAELEESDRLMSQGNDPLARASLANRGFVRDAKERVSQRKARSGLSTDQQLAGPRRDGESEASYNQRKQEARQRASREKAGISELAQHKQGFHIGGPDDHDPDDQGPDDRGPGDRGPDDGGPGDAKATSPGAPPEPPPDGPPSTGPYTDGTPPGGSVPIVGPYPPTPGDAESGQPAPQSQSTNGWSSSSGTDQSPAATGSSRSAANPGADRMENADGATPGSRPDTATMRAAGAGADPYLGYGHSDGAPQGSGSGVRGVAGGGVSGESSERGSTDDRSEPASGRDSLAPEEASQTPSTNGTDSRAAILDESSFRSSQRPAGVHQEAPSGRGARADYRAVPGSTDARPGSPGGRQADRAGSGTGRLGSSFGTTGGLAAREFAAGRPGCRADVRPETTGGAPSGDAPSGGAAARGVDGPGRTQPQSGATGAAAAASGGAPAGPATGPAPVDRGTGMDSGGTSGREAPPETGSPTSPGSVRPAGTGMDTARRGNDPAQADQRDDRDPASRSVSTAGGERLRPSSESQDPTSKDQADPADRASAPSQGASRSPQTSAEPPKQEASRTPADEPSTPASTVSAGGINPPGHRPSASRDTQSDTGGPQAGTETDPSQRQTPKPEAPKPEAPRGERSQPRNPASEDERLRSKNRRSDEQPDDRHKETRSAPDTDKSSEGDEGDVKDRGGD